MREGSAPFAMVLSLVRTAACAPVALSLVEEGNEELERMACIFLDHPPGAVPRPWVARSRTCRDMQVGDNNKTSMYASSKDSGIWPE